MSAPTFGWLIDVLERTHITEHLKPETTGAMYLGNDPPIYPEDYQARLDELPRYYVPNAWENAFDMIQLMRASRTKYDYAYKGFVNSPLESGVNNDAVRQWYNNARALAGLPPAPPRQVNGEGKPV